MRPLPNAVGRSAPRATDSRGAFASTTASACARRRAGTSAIDHRADDQTSRRRHRPATARRQHRRAGDGPLKQELKACAARTRVYKPTAFSSGHRVAPLQVPEHTRESYIAAARMGAGVLECDVAFTKDKEPVCRHAQNDLHTTTNILTTPPGSRCADSCPLMPGPLVVADAPRWPLPPAAASRRPTRP